MTPLDSPLIAPLACGAFSSRAAATVPIVCLAFLVLVLSMTWFDLSLPAGLVLVVTCGIAAVGPARGQRRNGQGKSPMASARQEKPRGFGSWKCRDHCGFASQGLRGLNRPNGEIEAVYSCVTARHQAACVITFGRARKDRRVRLGAS